MSSFKIVHAKNGKQEVTLTAKEKAARDIEEQAWVDGEPARKWASIRAQRDALLAACDYTQVADAPGDTAAWATYRQALRDLPANTVDVTNITWPTEPD